MPNGVKSPTKAAGNRFTKGKVANTSASLVVEPQDPTEVEDMQARALMLDVGCTPLSPLSGDARRRGGPLQQLRGMVTDEHMTLAKKGLPLLAVALVACFAVTAVLRLSAAGGAARSADGSSAAATKPELKDLARGLKRHIEHGPGASPPRVTFLTAETRGEPLLAKVGGFEDHFGKVINVAANRSWAGFQTKVDLLDAHLRAQVGLVGYDAPGAVESHLVVFTDGGDVFWGGCGPEDFRRYYQQISNASGASLVFSADVVCAEQDCNDVPDAPRWAGDLIGVGGRLNSDFWSQYATGCKGTWNDECAAKRDCGYWAPCARPPALKFLSSGFVMGPAKDMAEMVAWVRQNYEKLSVLGDQSVFASYWLAHKERVTLDYTGSLAMSISSMDYKLLHLNQDTGTVQNTALNRQACLVHGGGKGRDFLEYLVSLSAHKPFKAVRGF